MKETLANKDLIAISAYLDGRLPKPAAERFEKRLKEDSHLNKVCLEIDHARRLLRSLPQKRAPRNFTLSPQAAGASIRRFGLHTYFSLASATAALALVLVAGVNLIAPRAALKAPPPAADFAMLEAAPAEAPQAEIEATPLIFNWNPQSHADGLGGAGGGSDPKAMTSSDLSVESAELLEAEPFSQIPAEAAEEAQPEAAAVDPSTLILGLSEGGTEGETFTAEEEAFPSREARLPSNTWWMMWLGAATLVFAALAWFLRRR